MKKGLLVVNLGTPSAPTPKGIRTFLQEFLLDPDVIHLPWLVRQILVRCFILPFRPKRLVEAYQSIWDPINGSPLRHHTANLTKQLRQDLGWAHVAYAMRYGEPSFTQVLEQFPSSLDALWVLPLYPQYAVSTWGTVEKAVKAAYRELGLDYPLYFIPPFYNAPYFIEALAVQAQPFLSPTAHWLMSFHGLPEQHIRKSCTKPCVGNVVCPILKQSDELACYRAQCMATARLLAKRLGLLSHQYTVAFQSRVGRAPWIKPYSDAVLPELRSQGVKDLVVISPSFVSDCLETLEELAIRMKEQWYTQGGSSFAFVPALNSNPQWSKALVNILSDTSKSISNTSN